jgi:hypothetical protein
MIWLPGFWRSMIAIATVLATVMLVNVTPENPYQAVPPFLLSSQPTHLSSFSNIVRVLSQLWPLFAVPLLAALARERLRAPSSP